jgi:hypothetical protein
VSCVLFASVAALCCGVAAADQTSHVPQQSDGEGIEYDWMRGEALMALANLSLFLPPLSGRPQVRPGTSRHFPSLPIPSGGIDGSPQASLAAHSLACYVLHATSSSWSCMCMHAQTDHDT